jgi:two-component system osmolarity sensor histidine kinase EnvZ
MPHGISLLAGIAHDLRTPLARLRLRAELACPEEVSRAMEEDFMAVTHLIDQILGYAQACVVPGAAPGGHASLHEVLRRGVQAYRQAHADVSLMTLDEGHDLLLPRLPLQRVLGNLIDNALAHGLAPVQVELQAVPAGVDLLVFDAGPGLAPDHLADGGAQPFVRYGLPDAPARRHCGLGLAIVAQMAQQMGGRMVLRPFDGARSGIGIHIPSREV